VTEGGSKSWYIDIDEGKLEGEISWDLELGPTSTRSSTSTPRRWCEPHMRRWRRLPLYDIEDPDVGRSRPAASAPSRSVNVSL
jgi:hypothetical protein